MKASIVPAEMTSVQDKIIGSLNMNQVILLALPLIISILIYLLLPPFSKGSIIKIILCLILVIIFGMLSININGKIILEHLKVILVYLSRPKIYLSSIKNIQIEEYDSIENFIEEIIIETPPPILDRNIYFNFKKKDRLIFNLNKKGGLDAKVLRSA